MDQAETSMGVTDLGFRQTDQIPHSSMIWMICPMLVPPMGDGTCQESNEDSFLGNPTVASRRMVHRKGWAGGHP